MRQGTTPLNGQPQRRWLEQQEAVQVPGCGSPLSCVNCGDAVVRGARTCPSCLGYEMTLQLARLMLREERHRRERLQAEREAWLDHRQEPRR